MRVFVKTLFVLLAVFAVGISGCNAQMRNSITLPVPQSITERDRSSNPYFELSKIVIRHSYYFSENNRAKNRNLLNCMRSDSHQASRYEQVQKALERCYVKTPSGDIRDNYAYYYSPDEYREFLDDRDGNFSGIGVSIHWTDIEKKEDIRIKTVFPNSPAEDAGLQVGDIMRAVKEENGSFVSLSGKSLSDVAQLIRGKVGSTVQLRIERDKELLTFSIVRRNIDARRVIGRVLDRSVGLVKFYEFSHGIFTDKISPILSDFKRKGITNLILDLRGNPGGYLTPAVAIVSAFAKKDDVIVKLCKKNSCRRSVTAPQDGLFYTDFSIVILTDEFSASASEILAGALKRLGRATIVGETTYGKGSVQRTYQLNSGAGFKLTTDLYFLTGDFSPNSIGITPDYPITNPENYKLCGLRDAQCAKALELFQ